MRDWLGYALRNPGNLIIDIVDRQPSEVTKAARGQNDMRRAMAKHRRDNPTCYVTGIEKIAVHHIVPVSISPELRAEPSNFISLHPAVHKYLAHWGQYTNYTENIVEVCDWLRDNMIIIVTKRSDKQKMKTVFGIRIPGR